MQTGDGIQRVSGADAFLAPVGGEGGSVLRALGSKETKKEARTKRRRDKKENYAKYLESPTWRKIRARALKRDEHKCRACGKPALHVHHVRYPKKLGEEKMEWLYSLCVPCHDAIHRAAKTMPLRHATNLILGASEKNGNVTNLPDDWRLSDAATKARQLGPRKHAPPPSKKKKRKRLKTQPLHVAADRKKKQTLREANDELHAIFKANRERRERRWGHG